MVAKGVQSLLTGNRIPNGKIVKTTACSDATASNFHGITAIDRELNIEGSTFQETLSFPCFHFNEKPKRSVALRCTLRIAQYKIVWMPC